MNPHLLRPETDETGADASDREDAELRARFRDAFCAEASDLLQSLNLVLLELEHIPTEAELINEAFRQTHSLKGMAATMGYDGITALAHHMEGLLAYCRSSRTGMPPDWTALCVETVDAADQLVTAIRRDASELQAPAGLIEQLERALAGASGIAPSRRPEPQASSSDGLQPSAGEAPISSIRITMDQLDRLSNLAGEVSMSRSHLAELVEGNGDPRLREAVAQHARLVSALSRAVFHMRLISVAEAWHRFPRMVRDLSRTQGKQVRLILSGTDTRVDRSVLERVVDPITHLLRNAIDHGLEDTVQRRQAGKPAEGEIRLAARRENDLVWISVQDDGRGIDADAVTAKAVALGIVSPQDVTAMSPEARLLLIAQPGLSTAPEVTGVSGRGVGMDVVRRAVESMGGRLHIETAVGVGTTISLVVPVDISTTRVLLVESAGQTFGIPVTGIDRTQSLRDLSSASPDGGALPQRLIRLDRWAGARTPRDQAEDARVVIVRAGSGSGGLVVDRTLHIEEVVIRPLPPVLRDIPGVASATIMGDGGIVPILDVASLFR